MNLIILASGNSSRFKRVGYQKSKYCLSFLSDSVIDHLINIKLFNEITIVHNHNDINDKDLNLNYKYRLKEKKIKILSIKSHNNGPVYSLLLIKKHIQKDVPIAVSYCDYIASIFLEKENYKLPTNCDGSILIYKGFHPHHYFENNIYGYLKVDENNNVIDYKEKSTFTNNKYSEPCSAGLYLFNSGSLIIDGINIIMQNKGLYRIKDELYVSMIYKALLSEGKTFKVFETKYFAQLGTPEDYQDHIDWMSAAIELRKKNKTINDTELIDGTCIILLSGEGSRFTKEGYKTYKAFLSINKKTILRHLIEALPKFSRYAISIQKGNEKFKNEVIKSLEGLNINILFLEIISPNQGQADSAMQALKSLKNKIPEAGNKPVYIAPCDSILRFRERLDLINLDNDNIGMILAKTNPFSRSQPFSYSYAITDYSPDNGEIVYAKSIHVKNKPKEKSSIITGSFFSRNLDKLLLSMEERFQDIPLINGEKYLDSFCEITLEKGEDINCIYSDIYQSLGTPIEYQTALYWNSFIDLYK